MIKNTIKSILILRCFKLIVFHISKAPLNFRDIININKIINIYRYLA